MNATKIGMKYEFQLALRYLLAVALALFTQPMYYIMAPVTLYASYFLLNIFHPASLEGIKIFTEQGTFVFVEACVATLAYLLLAILILTTKNIGFRKSVAIFLHGSLIIFVVNIFRIELLIYAFLTGKDFDVIHIFFWEFVSTLLVFLTWMYLIKKYKVKTMPVFSDAHYLWKNIRK